MVVEVIQHLGPYEGREDAYWIRTTTGRPFHQLWHGKELMRGSIDECVTDRHKLRPLVGGEDDADYEVVERELIDAT
jgi:hypothetical protein